MLLCPNILTDVYEYRSEKWALEKPKRGSVTFQGCRVDIGRGSEEIMFGRNNGNDLQLCGAVAAWVVIFYRVVVQK